MQTGVEVTPQRLTLGRSIFLSHTWAQGQSDMRIVKHRHGDDARLRVFLDVDDLVRSRAGIHERSYAVLTFCTAKY